MMPSKTSIKNAALSVLKTTGAFHLVRESKWRSQRLLILCYHGFSLEDEHIFNGSLYMSPAHFETRLQLLIAGGYHVLPLGEALERLYSNRLPDKSAVITIDDGTYDFYRGAYPLLKAYNLPATVYLTTYYCYNNQPVFAILVHYLLWKSGQQYLDMQPLTGEETKAEIASGLGLHHWAHALKDYAAHFSTDEKTAFAQRIARQLNVDFDVLRAKRMFHVMNPEEVVEIAKHGIDIQLHTHRHRTPRDHDLFKREIRDNRERIQELTGKTPEHFCYPSGVYHKEFLPWLTEEGVKSATTCKVDLVNRETNPLLLPRLIDTNRQPAIRVESWLSGIATALPRDPGSIPTD
jgi:peptidoglycan/xylan/chitin deacetylase (PgdA/CDA1 family)